MANQDREAALAPWDAGGAMREPEAAVVFPVRGISLERISYLSALCFSVRDLRTHKMVIGLP